MSTKTTRIKLVVAYDGYDFCGFAPQHGVRTVYSTLTDGIRQVSGEVSEITGASRTDSGAHAKGQVVHFDTTNPMPPEKWERAVNAFLPHDLCIRKASKTHNDFHSRFWAEDRHYRYRILLGERDPQRTRYAFHHGRQINLQYMINAAPKFVGEHNFLAFSQFIEPGKNTVRTIRSVQIRQVKDEIWIDIVGTAFVRGMMRRIAGCLWEIGRGKYPAEKIEHLLNQTKKEEIEWPPVLPACGLTLMKIRYGRHPSEKRKHIFEAQKTSGQGQTE